MSRSGYSECCEGWDLIRWRGAVSSSIRGKRGQAFLKELADAMDKMEEKVLIADELIDSEGCCCTIGVVCKSRGLDVSGVDVYEANQVADLVGVADAMAKEIQYMNDEWSPRESPEDRWKRMRLWVAKQLKDQDYLRDVAFKIYQRNPKGICEIQRTLGVNAFKAMQLIEEFQESDTQEANDEN